MTNLQQFPAFICYTASATLIVDQKVLLVKHKKLGAWLCPGGHLEENEMPDKAAEREFLEETGIEVEVKPLGFTPSNSRTEFLPIPFAINLHWVAQENYDTRLKSSAPTERHPSKKWPRGCEQHYCWCYLVKPVGTMKELNRQVKEVTDARWFTRQELESIDLWDDVKTELDEAFRLTDGT